MTYNGNWKSTVFSLGGLLPYATNKKNLVLMSLALSWKGGVKEENSWLLVSIRDIQDVTILFAYARILIRKVHVHHSSHESDAIDSSYPIIAHNTSFQMCINLITSCYLYVWWEQETQSTGINYKEKRNKYFMAEMHKVHSIKRCYLLKMFLTCLFLN